MKKMTTSCGVLFVPEVFQQRVLRMMYGPYEMACRPGAMVANVLPPPALMKKPILRTYVQFFSYYSLNERTTEADFHFHRPILIELRDPGLVLLLLNQRQLDLKLTDSARKAEEIPITLLGFRFLSSYSDSEIARGRKRSIFTEFFDASGKYFCKEAGEIVSLNPNYKYRNLQKRRLVELGNTWAFDEKYFVSHISMKREGLLEKRTFVPATERDQAISFWIRPNAELRLVSGYC